MVNAETLLAPMRAGRTLLGLAYTYPAPGILEVTAAGWDFAWLDGQHGQLDHAALLAGVRTAAGLNLPTMVRVPTHDPGLLGWYADLGPDALMVPMVNSAEEARQIVQALCFAPRGCRSYGGRRLVDLGTREFYRRPHLAIVLQIETVAGVENAAAIAACEGVDVLFFGPDDMRFQLGLPTTTPLHEEPRLCEALRQTAAAARAAGKFCGTVTATPAQVRLAESAGCQMLVAGNDAGLLRKGATEALATLRPVVVAPTTATKA